MEKKGFCIFLAILLFSRIPSLAYDNQPISYLGIEHGLSNNAVTTIFQDHDGLMWFGTFDGLNRYDGYGFKVFRNNLNDPGSLNDNHITIIDDDANHHLWVGTRKGVNIYNPVKANFSSVKFKPWNSASLQPLKTVVRAIRRIDEYGTMLVGTVNNGLLVFEKGSLTGVQIPFAARRGHEGDYVVTAMSFGPDRQVAWVFVQHEGLCQYDLKHRTLRVVNTSFEIADCLKFDTQGNLWLGNEKGLFRYNIAGNTFSANVLPSALRVMDLFEDKQNVLWISSDGGGVWSMRVGSNRPVAYVSTTGSSLVNSNAVYAIYDDLQGNKWIGTLRGGINIIRPRAKLFNHISFNNADKNNIVNDFILSFAEDDKNNVWIGTDGAGLKYWDRRKNSFTSYKHSVNNPATISSDFVTSILRDSYNDIWATTWFGGVNRLKKNTGSFEHFDCINAQTGLVENNAWQAFEDSQKRLWICTMNGGSLYLFNRRANRFEVFDAALKNVHSLFEDRQREIWAADHTSLLRIDLVNKKHRSYEIGQGVRCIYEDRNRNFWIGTDGGGLLLFNRVNGSFRRFTTSDGLPGNTILQILEDRKNNLWLSTYNGLSEFNTVDKTCRNFSQFDGLQSNQFSLNAALALQSGEMLFGGIRGFNVFYPDSIHQSKETPKLFLTGLRVNNKPIEEHEFYVKERISDRVEKIELPYDEAFLSLDYLALDYSGADKIKYAYILEGWDKNWIDANEIRTANYSSLREGTYTFKIRIKNGAGEWNNETSLVTVVVLPPWYRTWWAYLLYGILAFSFIYFGFMYYKRQQRLKYEIQLANYEARLANFEKEKEKELAEKKLSFFTHISHEFRTPLTLIINPVKDLLRKIDSDEEQKELNIVHRNTRRLLSLIDQLLIFRKADVGADTFRFCKCNFYDVCNEVFLCFVQQAKMNHQDFVFQCENKELELYIDRQKIEIALFNLLSNAIKFTPEGGRITFTVSEKEKDVQVAITDSGYGIPKEAASRLFEKFYQASAENVPAKTGFGIGLYLVKHFVDGHKGEVSFESEPSKGTTFLVQLRKGQAHLEGQAILQSQQNDPVILQELKEEFDEEGVLSDEKPEELDDVVTDRQTVLIADDDKAIRQYLRQVLKDRYLVLEAEDGEQALRLARENFPDLVISDIRMNKMDGIELCKQIKQDHTLNHTPVILLTGSQGTEVELKSIEGGADVYITKPFDKDILLAKMENVFKRHNELQQYFFNEITLKKNTLKISPEYKAFLEKCIQIVESHFEDDQFTIKTFATEIGMSHNQLYKRVKLISGQTVTSFIRFIRLRKAAALMIQNDCNVNQAAYQVGISDVKYFRVQFNKLFGMNPSEYIKKYRESFNRTYQISPNVIKDQPKK
jgi:ligand-binding sensor domain-containing protein/signal transduction histidine kinase/CheY-like chemotaxis protein/AraC-like DNA-binding protein